MYAGQWHEIETELKLNTVYTGSNTYLPDGELRAWVDGRLVWEGTGSDDVLLQYRLGEVTDREDAEWKWRDRELERFLYKICKYSEVV